jgi:hypothetical protein
VILASFYQGEVAPPGRGRASGAGEGQNSKFNALSVRPCLSFGVDANFGRGA